MEKHSISLNPTVTTASDDTLFAIVEINGIGEGLFDGFLDDKLG